MRSLGRQVAVLSVIFALAGCSGGDTPTGMPEDKSFTPAPTAPFMDGGSKAQKQIPKAGASGADSGAAPAPAPATK